MKRDTLPPPKRLPTIPQSLKNLPNPPQQLFYCGQDSILDAFLNSTPAIAPKIAIVGTRKPNPYTKSFVAHIAHKIARHNGIVVSGGALGVDIIAHINAMPRTIMFSPASLDILYPKSNALAIKQIMEKAVVLSEYEKDYMPHRYSFLERNRLVIGLSDYVIIPQADKLSGSMQSARIALELDKPLFVLPHRIGESEGTNSLLASGRAKGIYNVADFIESIFGAVHEEEENDEILSFCAHNPSFEEAYKRFGDRIYEYELAGKIIREASSIRLV